MSSITEDNLQGNRNQNTTWKTEHEKIQLRCHCGQSNGEFQVKRDHVIKSDNYCKTDSTNCDNLTNCQQAKRPLKSYGTFLSNHILSDLKHCLSTTSQSSFQALRHSYLRTIYNSYVNAAVFSPNSREFSGIQNKFTLHSVNRDSSTSKRIRRHSSSASLDLVLCSLNLNNLSLPEVHRAMGKEGSPQGISPEKEAYYRDIFNKLDVDNDGRIDVDELKQAYGEMGLLQVPGQAEKFVSASDKNKDGELDVTEFVRYLHEHEMKLRLMFKQMDQNKDGRLTYHEIEAALRSVGFEVTKEEAKKITQRMDKDGTSTIDLDEWVEHHLLHPSADIRDIAKYWTHGKYIDIGESLIVPDDFSEEEKVSGLWWRQLVAGGAAGVVSRTCTAPLDRLKVLMQVHASKANKFGIISGFKSMLKEGGVKSLWRGNGINVIKIAPETAVKFMAYENMKKLLGAQSHTEIGAPLKFLAGSSAGVISQTVIYPMEVVKTRLALRKTGQYKGILDCFYKVLQNEGPRAFFKGYVPNCIGIIPYAGIDLCIYETLKNTWIKKHSAENHKPSILLLLACGTVSSTCGQLSSYPLALVRTKMQAQASLPSKNQEKLTMVSLFRSIVQTDGIFGLYRGLAPNFMKVVPAVSISYVVYENMRMQLGVYR